MLAQQLGSALSGARAAVDELLMLGCAAPLAAWETAGRIALLAAELGVQFMAEHPNGWPPAEHRRAAKAPAAALHALLRARMMDVASQRDELTQAEAWLRDAVRSLAPHAARRHEEAGAAA